MDGNSDDARDQFFIARSEALNAYALLEQALCILFSRALGTDPHYATLIVSKIVNTRARNGVIQKVLDHATNKRFRLFTNSLFATIGQVDGLRNQLVHWHVEELTPQTFVLKPADPLSKSPERMTETEIDELAARCLFLASTISLFDDVLGASAPQPWNDIFAQPLNYPPAPDHPLSRFHIGNEVPQRSSPA